MKKLNKEIERTTRILELYHSLGHCGSFGVKRLSASLAFAKSALEANDIEKMNTAYVNLKSYE